MILMESLAVMTVHEAEVSTIKCPASSIQERRVLDMQISQNHQISR